MFTGPKMKAAFYIDKRSSEEQVDALTKIFSGQSGGFFAAAANLICEVLGIKTVPITFEMQGRRRRLHIPEFMELEIEAMKGNNAEIDSLVTNPSFTVAPGYDPIIARSSKNAYMDLGFERDSSGKNGFYSRFKYGP